ncbi:MAG TPA: YjgP/YjgQ family permease [Flavobacteriales bacterium]|nr:YjgP/YjgQ family permease [Flavobacteriales bacterium]
MKIIDKYILKRYFGTFLWLMLLFVPISIILDLSERIDKFIEHKVPIVEILGYYGDFLLYFFNILFPIFLFLSVIWFTSRLAQNTEIIAMLNTGMPFMRLLRPYLIGATIIAVSVLLLNLSIIPKARIGYNEFWVKYVHSKSFKARETNDVYRQIDSTHYIYASNLNHQNKTAYNFVMEEVAGDSLKSKLYADRIVFHPKTKKYTLHNLRERHYLKHKEKVIEKGSKDTVFNFTLDDLTPVTYIAEGLNYSDLNKFIEKEKLRGSKNIKKFELEKYKRMSLPISAFILTFIAVAMASQKRRSGMGGNLAFGITVSMIYILFDRIFGVMVIKSGFSPFWAAWIPNIIFGLLAVYLVFRAKK